MSVFGSYANLMTILDELGQVAGRKKLQKIVYICQKAGLPVEEDFDYYLYGPYSESLSNKLEELTFFGLVDEEKEQLSGGYQQYLYKLSAKGKELAETLVKLPPEGRRLLRILNTYDGRFLELVATLWFLLDQGYSENQAREEVFNWLKPEQHYTLEEFSRAWQLISKIKEIMAGDSQNDLRAEAAGNTVAT